MITHQANTFGSYRLVQKIAENIDPKIGASRPTPYEIEIFDKIEILIVKRACYLYTA
jgi:hypothetical protein